MKCTMNDFLLLMTDTRPHRRAASFVDATQKVLGPRLIFPSTESIKRVTKCLSHPHMARSHLGNSWCGSGNDQSTERSHGNDPNISRNQKTLVTHEKRGDIASISR
mmetsp:Transcript_6533/g.13644  ORF Transcript_6533/g.13644 Transcript_6533/m.13644 type:complete len:106 (-) Transcript_6533:803-1120(-)